MSSKKESFNFQPIIEALVIPALIGYLIGCFVLHQDPFYIIHLLKADEQLWRLFA